MPRVRVPIRRTGYRYSARPGRRYPVAPVASVAPRSSGLAALIGGLGGLLLCLLCLATLGLLGLFATFIAVTAYLGDVYRAVRDANNGTTPSHFINMAILLAALCFAGYHKLRRSL